MYWKEEYIDLLIKRNLLDFGTLIATDEITDDAMSKPEETEKKQVWKLEKPTDKGNNVGNENEMEKVLIRLLGAVKEGLALLKFVIFGSFLWINSLHEELMKYVTMVSFNKVTE